MIEAALPALAITTRALRWNQQTDLIALADQIDHLVDHVPTFVADDRHTTHALEEPTQRTFKERVLAHPTNVEVVDKTQCEGEREIPVARMRRRDQNETILVGRRFFFFPPKRCQKCPPKELPSLPPHALTVVLSPAKKRRNSVTVIR